MPANACRIVVAHPPDPVTQNEVSGNQPGKSSSGNAWNSRQSRRPDSNRGPLHYETCACVGGGGSAAGARSKHGRLVMLDGASRSWSGDVRLPKCFHRSARDEWSGWPVHAGGRVRARRLTASREHPRRSRRPVRRRSHSLKRSHRSRGSSTHDLGAARTGAIKSGVPPPEATLDTPELSANNRSRHLVAGRMRPATAARGESDAGPFEEPAAGPGEGDHHVAERA
jgi:hypothetical protein